MNNKHAYLIMAHNNFEILKKIIVLLDNEKNDIFIHIDKKVKNIDIRQFEKIAKKSKVKVLNNRIDIHWGGYSQIECELLLLKESINGEYSYYHLISGVDLPLTSSEKIYEFFERNKGKEFVHFREKSLTPKDKERISLYHFFQENLKNKKNKKNLIYGLLEYISLRLQKLLKVDRTKKTTDITYMCGANWFSITNELAKFVLQKEDFIKKTFIHTRCADEIFLQTIVYNSKFKDNLYYNKMDDNYKACMRYVDWTRGKPYVWRFNNFSELINSDYLFARKFDYKIDNKIINKVYNWVRKEEEI